MASPLKAINLVAPGFLGINTEDTPLAQDPSFAEIANNAVIDRRGRVSSRRGLIQVSDNPATADPIKAMYHFRSIFDDSEHFFSCSNNMVFVGLNPRVDITPAGYTISDDRWQITSMDDRVYFFQAGHEPLVYLFDNNTSGIWELVPMSGVVGAAGVSSDMYGNCVLSAWGRLWVGASDSSPDVVYWSDTLIGQVWDSGAAGLIDMTYAWPNGDDRVVGLAAHGSDLIIFGENQTVMFAGADVVADPTASVTFQLSDSLSDIGCSDRDSIQDTGSDIFWLSSFGVQSLGRVVQNESLPLSNMSTSVQQDVISALEASSDIESVYYTNESYYILRIGSEIFCFNSAKRLPDNAMRCTKWNGPFNTLHYSRVDKLLYSGTSNGYIAIYQGFKDFNSSYNFLYVSSGLTFGDSSALKFPKKIQATIVGYSDEGANILWSLNFRNPIRSPVSIIRDAPGDNYYGQVTSVSVQANGSGQVVAVGFEAAIDGTEISIQEMTLFAKLGKQI